MPVIGEKLLAKRISQGIFTFGLIGGILTLIKKPRYALLFLFGFANIVFIGFMVGFGAYVKGYIPRFWVDRLYNWPYLFTAILIIIFLFYFLPKKLGKFSLVSHVFAWIFLFSGILISQLVWKPINYFMEPIASIYNNEKLLATNIASNYEGGVILLPEDHPYVTYFLAHDFKISAKYMEGQMFDPFFYFENKNDPFANWSKDREKIIRWLKNDNIKLIVLTSNKPTYMGLIEREPQYFKEIPSLPYIKIFRVEIN